MVVGYLLVLCVLIFQTSRLVHCRRLQLQEGISFFGQNVSHAEWQKRQYSIHELTTRGKWVDAWKDNPSFSPMYSVACHRIYKYSYEKCSFSSPNVGLQYTWKSHSQKNYPWDTQHFCRMMNGRNLMIVGDSLNEELFFALYSTMTAHVPPYRNITRDDTQGIKDRLYHECTTAYCELMTPNCDKTLTFSCGSDLPSFTVTLASSYVMFDDAEYYFKKYSMNPFPANPDDQGDRDNWVTKVADLNISVLLINHGAHFVPLNESVAKHNRTFSNLFTLHPHLSVFYRNTPPGHANCNDLANAPPLDAPQDLLTHPPNDYHWGEFAEVNLAIHRLLHSHFPQIVWVDVATSGALRADSHVGGDDCLHYCTPGPIDNWLLLFYQAMILATDQLPPEEEEAWVHQYRAIEATLVPLPLQMFLPPDQRDPRGDVLMHNKGSPYVFLHINGTKRPFNSGQVFMAMGREFSEIKKIDSKTLCNIPTGPPIY